MCRHHCLALTGTNVFPLSYCLVCGIGPFFNNNNSFLLFEDTERGQMAWWVPCSARTALQIIHEISQLSEMLLWCCYSGEQSHFCLLSDSWKRPSAAPQARPNYSERKVYPPERAGLSEHGKAMGLESNHQQHRSSRAHGTAGRKGSGQFGDESRVYHQFRTMSFEFKAASKKIPRQKSHKPSTFNIFF